jgi:polysaccharide export outer membrane protein
MVITLSKGIMSVAGEGIQGARVPLSPGGDRLLQVIAAAGGSDSPVHDVFVRLSRNGITASVPMATMQNAGSMSPL